MALTQLPDRVGFLAIPTLAGSAAYVFTETFGFRQGLTKGCSARALFYGILVLSILFGMALDFHPDQAMDALFWSASSTAARALCSRRRPARGLRQRADAEPTKFDTGTCRGWNYDGSHVRRRIAIFLV